MTDYSHKERPPIDDVAEWLASHHGERVLEVAPVRGGYWSSAWSYRLGDVDLILRLGESDTGYCIDKAAEEFATAGIPVPRVLHVGPALGKDAAISIRHFGSFVEEAELGDATRVGDALAGLLAAMKSVQGREVEWHRQLGGAADWQSWLGRGLPLGATIERPWSLACETHAELDAIRDRAEAAIMTWLPKCPDRRDLIHRDLLHQNVLVEGDHVMGIFSWKHSLFGDFLYDVAACSLWSDWHPAVAAAGIWNRVLDEVPGHDLVDAEQRHRVYQLHIAIEHLYWYVRNGDDIELARLLEVMKRLL